MRHLIAWWHRNICGPTQPGDLSRLDLLDGTRFEDDRDN